MLDKFKYIIFDGTTGFDGFIFPPYVQHEEFARKFNWPVLSAGFIRVHSGHEILEEGIPQIECFSKSISLKKESQPGDERAFEYLIRK